MLGTRCQMNGVKFVYKFRWFTSIFGMSWKTRLPKKKKKITDFIFWGENVQLSFIKNLYCIVFISEELRILGVILTVTIQIILFSVHLYYYQVLSLTISSNKFWLPCFEINIQRIGFILLIGGQWNLPYMMHLMRDSEERKGENAFGYLISFYSWEIFCFCLQLNVYKGGGCYKEWTRTKLREVK